MMEARVMLSRFVFLSKFLDLLTAAPTPLCGRAVTLPSWGLSSLRRGTPRLDTAAVVCDLFLTISSAGPSEEAGRDWEPLGLFRWLPLLRGDPGLEESEDLGGDSIRRTLIVGECVRSSDPCLFVSSSDPCLRGRPLAPPTGPGGEEESPFVDGSSTEGPSLRRAEGGEIEVGGGGKEDGG